ncbi:DMT family transporter [Couchioplanes caeruleus]|uniref:DMT family transporter n=1 Tax=Couchioplanes caeruleus TaxID=56438 RepID=UPI0020BF8DEF|nr:DMT family transporter [Couchioplanes caeruleus]UQU65495.1 DMT family transporter [Couchioplanes caeruleus]
MNTRSTPALLTIAALTVAVLAVSSSAPLIAFAAAPALAIAFWRNSLAFAALTPISAGPRRAEVRTLLSADGMYCVLAGLALALHFSTWMPSVQLGSVATATALVATQPVWQGLIAVAVGGRSAAPSRTAWIGIVLAVAGVAWATGVDIGVSAQAVLADVLALIGAMAAAVYTAFGERARRRLSTTTYTWSCYGTCAAVLLVVCLIGGVRLTGYDGRTWAAILALVVGAQLLGHSMFNYALHHVSATTVSVLILLEVPGAALLAWAWLGQVPRAEALPGLAVLVAGVAVVILGGARRRNGRPASASLAEAADPERA